MTPPNSPDSSHRVDRRLVALPLLPLILLLAGLLLTPEPASADTRTFRNTAPITVPDSGPASPTPSTIGVTGLRARVTGVQVALQGVTHTNPADLDVLLVAPDGHKYVVMSDACGAADVTARTWVFSASSSPPAMGGDSCPQVYYRPTDLAGEGDDWPGAPPGPVRALDDLFRKAMNGQWMLHVTDDKTGDSGWIASGWSLQFTTVAPDTLIPASGTSGPADDYPITRSIPDTGEVVTDVDIGLAGIAHDRPEDLDLLLVGPRGQKVMLMSDACGNGLLDTTLRLDDGAPAGLPHGADVLACSGLVTPTDFEPGDQLPAPAPSGPYATSLSAFALTDPAGEWKLYAYDDAEGSEGYLELFQLTVRTRATATVELAADAVELAEGAKRAVTVTRIAKGELGAGTVTVRSEAGNATAGADFTPLHTTLQFARGEREKTVDLDALADGIAEDAETYALVLSQATGDAKLETRTRLDATISPSAADPVAGGSGGEPGAGAGAGGGVGGQEVLRCAGEPATIVGTAGRDVLRGTAGRDVIVARGGADTIRAARGADLVCAGGGRDTVTGGAGRDRLYGGAGPDRLYGGAGRDTCLGAGGRDRVVCERTR